MPTSAASPRSTPTARCSRTDGQAPHWPADVLLQNATSCLPPIWTFSNWPGDPADNLTWTGNPTAQFLTSDDAVTEPTPAPFAADVSLKSSVPAGAVPSEQLGQAVR